MIRLPILGALALAALAGCSKKPSECDAVTKIINPAAEKITAAAGRKAEKAEDYAKVMGDTAKASEDAAAALAKVELTVPEIKRLSSDYQAMSKAVAAAAREMAEAAKAVEDGGNRIEGTAKDLEGAATKLAVVCGAAKDEKDQKACAAFGLGLKKVPADATKTAEVEKALAELDAIEWKSDEPRAVAKAVTAAARANNEVMVHVNAAQAKAEAAQKKLSEAADKEDKVVDGLNKLCQP